MNLYDLLSWGITANGVKDSTIYCFKPINGIGDLTFSRASNALRINSEGNTELVSENIMRLDHKNGCPELLFEQERTNLFLNSDELSTQDVVVTEQGYAVSFEGTGTITLSGAYDGSLVGTGENDRVELRFTPTTEGTLTCNVSGSVKNAQLEAGAYATSYIATEDAPITRSRDLTTRITGADSLIGQTEGTVFFEAASWTDGVHKSIFSLGDASDYLHIRFRNNNNFEVLLRVGSGTTTVNVSSNPNIPPYEEGVFYKVAVRYKAGEVPVIFVNGTKKSGVDVFPGWEETVSQIWVASSPGDSTTNFYGRIRNILLWPEGLSDDLCVTLTT